MKHHPILVGLVDAVEAAIYVALVATVMTSAQQWFGGAPDHPPFGAIAILMLLVLSAAVMGSIIFIRPALAYLEGKKKEAIAALGWTIGFLFALTAIAFVIVAAVR